MDLNYTFQLHVNDQFKEEDEHDVFEEEHDIDLYMPLRRLMSMSANDLVTQRNESCQAGIWDAPLSDEVVKMQFLMRQMYIIFCRFMDEKELILTYRHQDAVCEDSIDTADPSPNSNMKLVRCFNKATQIYAEDLDLNTTEAKKLLVAYERHRCALVADIRRAVQDIKSFMEILQDQPLPSARRKSWWKRTFFYFRK